MRRVRLRWMVNGATGWMMGEVKEALDAFAKLAVVFGPVWTVAIVVLLIGYHEFKEWRQGKRERTIAD